MSMRMSSEARRCERAERDERIEEQGGRRGWQRVISGKPLAIGRRATLVRATDIQRPSLPRESH